MLLVLRWGIGWAGPQYKVHEINGYPKIQMMPQQLGWENCLVERA